MNLASHSHTLERTSKAIRVHPDDHVGVALQAIAAGEIVRMGDLELAVSEAIETGHKFALHELAPGDTVLKFGWPIGRATARIAAGEHVHTHNVETLLSGLEGYRFAKAAPAPLPSAKDVQFLGYRRGDGRVGTRNEIWILPTVGCVARTAERIASIPNAQLSGALDGVYVLQHPFGCSQLGEDLAGTRSLLASLACNPNAGGVLIIGLGCESNQLDALLDEFPEELRGKVRTLTAQTEEDEVEAGLALVAALAAQAVV